MLNTPVAASKDYKMEPKIITSKKEYETSLEEAERLIALDPKPGTLDADRLSLFAVLIETYENKHFPIAKPDPIEAIKFRMEEQGLMQQDLIQYIGSKSKVSEVLSGKRPLTIRMILELNKGLDISAEVLLQENQKSQDKADIMQAS